MDMTPSTPSMDQVISWVRTTIALISGWAMGRGIGDANLWMMVGGVATALVPYVWGTFAHSDAAKIAAVADMPDVKKIEVRPSATGALADAVTDPTRPKVVAATP